MRLNRFFLTAEPTEGGGAASPETIQIPASQYQALLASQAATEAAGKKAADLQGQLAESSKSLALRDYTAGINWLSPTAQQQALRLMAENFVAEPDASGTLQVIDKATRRPASEVIPELLQGMEYGHFIKERHIGGAPPVEGWRASPTPQYPPAQARTVGEQLINDWKARQATIGPNDLSRPRFLGRG